MDYLTQKEKAKIIEALRYDQFFREEFKNIFLDTEIIKEITKGLEEELWDYFNDKVSDMSYEAISEVKEDVYEKVIDMYDDEIMERVVENFEDKFIKENKDEIMDIVAERMAREIISLEDKKELKEKVQNKMIKMRSYRHNVLDLD